VSLRNFGCILCGSLSSSLFDYFLDIGVAIAVSPFHERIKVKVVGMRTIYRQSSRADTPGRLQAGWLGRGMAMPVTSMPARAAGREFGLVGGQPWQP